MKRTDLMDTSESAWRIMLERLRSMTPEQRVAKTFEMIEEGRRFRKLTEHLRKPAGSQ